MYWQTAAAGALLAEEAAAAKGTPLEHQWVAAAAVPTTALGAATATAAGSDLGPAAAPLPRGPAVGVVLETASAMEGSATAAAVSQAMGEEGRVTAAGARAPSAARPAATETGPASGSREAAPTAPQLTVRVGLQATAMDSAMGEGARATAEAVGGSAMAAEGWGTLRQAPVSRWVWMPAGPACRPPTARRRSRRAACTAGHPATRRRRSAGWPGIVAASTASRESDCAVCPEVRMAKALGSTHAPAWREPRLQQACQAHYTK